MHVDPRWNRVLLWKCVFSVEYYEFMSLVLFLICFYTCRENHASLFYYYFFNTVVVVVSITKNLP